MEDRKCHICRLTGHTARRCPNKDKAAPRPASRSALWAQAGSSIAIVPYKIRTFLGVVTDDEGFQQPRRPRPPGVTFGELPVTHREATQKLRKAGKFAALIDDDEDRATNGVSTSSSIAAAAGKFAALIDDSEDTATNGVSTSSSSAAAASPITNDASASSSCAAAHKSSKKFSPKKDEN